MSDRQKWAKRIGSLILLFLMVSTGAAAQKSAAKQVSPSQAEAAASDTANISETHAQLMDLLRNDHKVSAFVSRDPQLLADRDFIARNNPQLAAFLESHPEVTKNPEYYLFADIGDGHDNGRRMSPEDWSGYTPPSMWREVIEFVGPFLIFICLLLAVLWLVRTLLESRRWSRLLHVQTDAQNKLLDKFGNSEQLLEYLRSDVDKRLLAPIGVQLAPNGSSISNPVARILGPLQAGVILTVVGMGFIALRNMGMPEGQDVFTAIGMIVMTLGIGLIIAAGAGWFLARHFGMLPNRSAADAAHDV